MILKRDAKRTLFLVVVVFIILASVAIYFFYKNYEIRFSGGELIISEQSRIFVDNFLEIDCINGDYSIRRRDCSGNDGIAYNTLQEAADIATAGYKVEVRGGTFQDQLDYCAGAQCRLVRFGNSGTERLPIIVHPYKNERVVFLGFGFEDRDLNNDGYADGPLYPNKRETLILIDGNHVYVRGFELTNSQGYGILIRGSFNLIEVYVHDTWFNGILIGDNAPTDVEGNVIQYSEVHNTRKGTGISITIDSAAPHPYVTKNIVRNSISYNNGRLPNGTRVLPDSTDPAGGGNSDGMGGGKNCHDMAINDGDPSTENFCYDNIFEKNIVWGNTDDGFDTSQPGLFIGNIAFNNGRILPLDGRAHQGWKNLRVFHPVNGFGAVYVRNIIFNNEGDGFQWRSYSGSKYYNNLAVYNRNFGINNLPQEGKNNLAAFNSGTDIGIMCRSNPYDCSNNWAANGVSNEPWVFTGDPLFTGRRLNTQEEIDSFINTDFPQGLSIREKHEFIRNQFGEAFSLQENSHARDNGVVVTYRDPVSGEIVTLPFVGRAPDIGPFEFEGDTSNFRLK